MRHVLTTFLWLVVTALAVLPTLSMADDKPAEPAKPNAERETLFKQLDKNGDGVVTADEVSDDQKRLFTRLLRSDKNEDGKLSLEEFLAGTQEDRPARRPEGTPPSGDQPRRPEAGDLKREAEAIFKQLDANGDGKVVIDEIPADRRERVQQMLARADANGDKVLTLDEFVVGFIAARGGQPGQPPRPGTPPTTPSGQPVPGEGLIRLFDTDGDGKLGVAELAAAGDVLKKLDRDGDGNLNREELMAGIIAKFAGNPPTGTPQPARPQPGQPEGRFNAEQMLARLKQADRNGDGKWSKEELPERMAEHFARLDANGDGFVDEAELKKSFEMLARAAGGRPGQEGGGFLDRIFKEADKDNDGKLSKDEAPPKMKERFDELDRNKDGLLDRAEIVGGFRGGDGDAPRKRPEQRPEQRPEKKDAEKKDSDPKA